MTLPVVIAVGSALLLATSRALSRNHGRGKCAVCDEGLVYDIDEYTRIGAWFRSRRHNWIISSQKWHRDAWARNRWNPYRLPGYPKDDGTAAIRRPKPNVFRRAFWVLFN